MNADSPIRETSHTGSRLLLLLPFFLALLVPLLYCGVLLHFGKSAAPGSHFVGIVHIDQLVYYASAREYADSSLSLFYASPYSSSASSPRIYTHFIFLLMSLLLRAGMSITQIDYGIRLLGGTAMLALIALIFRCAYPGKRTWILPACAVIMCSGIAWLLALLSLLTDYVLNIGTPRFQSSLLDWLRGFGDSFATMEGGYGEWHLSLSRNLLYAPEILYHVLYFACVLCCLSRRHVLALVLLFLTWWSHPFTGVELAGILIAYYFMEAVMRKPEAVKWLVLASAITALFLWYNFIFLSRFPEHRSISIQMREFGNPMQFSKLIPAYGIFLFLPVLYFVSPAFLKDVRQAAPVRFMSCWLAVSLLLSFHDRWLIFIHPIQPMHFTHGYVFVPLVYFSGLSLVPLWQRYSIKRKTRWLYALVCVTLLIQLPDDAIFLWRIANDHSGSRPMEISDDLLHCLNELQQLPPATVLISGSGDHLANAFLPVLTHHRPFLAHQFNTPFYAEKRAASNRLFDAEAAQPIHPIPELLVTSSSLSQHFAPVLHATRINSASSSKCEIYRLSGDENESGNNGSTHGDSSK